MRHQILFESVESAISTIEKGRVYTILIADVKYSLLRIEESFFVFEKNCPHSGHSLQTAKSNFNNELVCPSHAYRFSLRNGQEAENRCRPL